MEAVGAFIGAWFDARFRNAGQLMWTLWSVGRHVAVQSEMDALVADFAWKFVFSTATLIVLFSLVASIFLAVFTYKKLPAAPGAIVGCLLWAGTKLVSLLRIIMAILVFVVVLVGCLYLLFRNHGMIEALRQWNETF